MPGAVLPFSVLMLQLVFQFCVFQNSWRKGFKPREAEATALLSQCSVAVRGHLGHDNSYKRKHLTEGWLMVLEV